jgi:hypothetical protein
VVSQPRNPGGRCQVRSRIRCSSMSARRAGSDVVASKQSTAGGVRVAWVKVYLVNDSRSCRVRPADPLFSPACANVLRAFEFTLVGSAPRTAFRQSRELGPQRGPYGISQADRFAGDLRQQRSAGRTLRETVVNSFQRFQILQQRPQILRAQVILRHPCPRLDLLRVDDPPRQMPGRIGDRAGGQKLAAGDVG